MAMTEDALTFGNSIDNAPDPDTRSDEEIARDEAERWREFEIDMANALAPVPSDPIDWTGCTFDDVPF